MIFEPRLIAGVRKRLAEDLDRFRVELGSGSQLVGDDPTATGMRTARYVGRIEGLTRALVAIDEVEDELSGKAKKSTREER